MNFVAAMESTVNIARNRGLGNIALVVVKANQGSTFKVAREVPNAPTGTVWEDVSDWSLELPADCSLAHLEEMLNKMKKGDMSNGKANRWLGWAQGVLVVLGLATLEEMKQVNKRWRDD